MRILLPIIMVALLGAACGGDVAGPFQEYWRADVGDCRRCAVAEGPAAVAVVADGNRLFLFRSDDGTLLWNEDLGTSPSRGLALYGDVVLAGDWEGNLVAREVGSGAERWRLTIPDRFYSPFNIQGDILYCGAGEKVYAIDLARREVKWSTRLEAEADVRARPVVEDERLFLQAGTHVYALAADTGAKLWAYETTSYAGGDYYCPVAVGHGRVFTGTPTKDILALDEDDGGLRWSSPVGKEVWNDRLVVEPHLYAGRLVFAFDAILVLEETTEGPSSENAGRIVCLSARNGKVKWTYDAPSFGGVAFRGGNVYLASGSDVHVVNVKSGRGAAVPIPGEYTAGLATTEEAVYFVVDGRYLVRGDFSS